MFSYRGKIVRVVDGDTLVVDIDLGFHTWRMGEHVRLLGIDTPEMTGPDKNRGMLAKMFVSSLISEYDDCSVVVETKTPRDKYGRYLANIWFVKADGTHIDLTEELIKAGHVK